jgi:hypothetical protein
MLYEDYEQKKCVYCGEGANTIDHVVPVSYYYSGVRKIGSLHLTAEYGKENIVPSCKECNNIAWNHVFQDFEAKKDYIQNRLVEKYKKAINCPFWSEEEVKEMGKQMQKEIKLQQLAKYWILNRINYPKEMYPVATLNKQLKHYLEKVL